MSCPHCLPTLRTNHAAQHLEYYADKLTAWLPATHRHWGRLMKLLSYIGIVRFVPVTTAAGFSERSAIFLSEALERGINVENVRVFGKNSEDFRFRVGAFFHYYESIPLTLLDPADEIDFKDKMLVKNILRGSGLPVPEGKIFTDCVRAFAYGHSLGYPLMVKPNAGSLSWHVTGPVTDDDGLRASIDVARSFRPDFIVERFIAGRLYRASVIGRNRVFVCEKRRARVVGNGKETIAELVANKNRTAGRPVPLDQPVIISLRARGLSPDSVPVSGAEIILGDKFILARGAEVVACTKQVHSVNRELFISAAGALKTDLVGLDFIAADIAKPYNDQECAIIEANSLPYLEMHATPVQGDPDPVAAAVWDCVLAKINGKL